MSKTIKLVIISAMFIILSFALLALSVSAYTAFSVFTSPFHAFLLATVVEFGAVVGAVHLTTARSWTRQAIGFVECAAGWIISGTYNYIHVSQSSAMNDGWWFGLVLALGPLVMASFTAFSLGGQLREYMDASDKVETVASRTELEREKMRLEAEDRARARREKLAHAEEMERIRAMSQFNFGGVGGGQRETNETPEPSQPSHSETNETPAPSQPSQPSQRETRNETTKSRWVRRHMEDTGCERATAYRHWSDPRYNPDAPARDANAETPAE